MKNRTPIEALESRIAPAVVFAVEADTNKLVSFDSAAPGILLSDTTITGLAAGEFVAGIDIDQRSGVMYAVAIKDDGATRSGHYYTIDPATAVATQYAPFGISGLPDTSALGFEARGSASFNTATSDDVMQFASYNPAGGTGGGSYTFDNPTGVETVTALAISDVFGRSPTTYVYNFSTDELAVLEHNNATGDEELTAVGHVTVGGSNIVANSTHMGFDIASSPVEPERGWMSLFRSLNGTHFYSVDLATAALTDLGAIGGGTRLFTGLTVSVAGAAPTIVGGSATWMEADGDTVTLTLSKGTLTPANFKMFSAGAGTFLGELTLGSEFEGANLTVTAKAGPQGDGQVVIGSISANGVDLGVVKIGGTLAQITVGNINAPAPSVKSFTATGIEQKLYTDFGSRFNDGAGSVLIKGDFSGSINLGYGKTGSVTIAGNLNGGVITGDNHIEKVLIKGSVFGGSISSSGTGGSVKIGGSIVGGEQSYSGRIYFVDGVKSVTVAGNLVGGPGVLSGNINSQDGVTTIKIGGSVFGGTGDLSGSISGRTLTSLTIGGGVFASAGATDAIEISAYRIGTLAIKGAVVGTAESPIHITAFGKSQPATQAEATAIGKVTIGGDLVHGYIGAGMGSSLQGFNVDAAIGVVKIGGSMIASSITAGINIGSGLMAGDADDALAGGNVGNQAIIAKIASITIGGQLRGTAGGVPDSFGIEAELLGPVKIGKTLLPLNAAKNDLTLGFTGDVRVREL